MTTRRATAALAAYVLHRYDWSESSLILDLFTRELGRVAAVAKGAKRPYSQLRPVLLPFQRINVSFSRAASADEAREVHNLRAAEWAGGAPMLGGDALFAGFYLNELLMKMLARHDPHALLFDAYASTLPSLASADEGHAQAALRAFELLLLRESGLLPELDVVTLTRQPVQAGVRYLLRPESGVVASGNEQPALDAAALGALQRALGAGDLAALQAACAAELPALRGQLRTLLHYHLGTASLRTRQLMRDLQRLTHIPTRT
jgi:DNA repair protein RecO (recombination protein O)